jgi:hypothetical protein
MDSMDTRLKWTLSAVPIFIILVFITSASAHGPFGAGLPLFGGSSGEFSPCTPSKSACGPLTLYAGWGDDRKGTTVSFDLRHPGTDDLLSIITTYPVSGLWLGLAAQASLTDPIGLYADAWMIVPSNRESEETYSVAPSVLGGKTWRTSTEWWLLNGALTYSTCNLGRLVAGFRYDRFATNLKDPDNFVGALGLSSDRGDITINCYVPFIGVQMDQGSLVGSRLMFRIIGFPWLGGDVKYHDSIGNFVIIEQDRIELSKGLGKGYFLEVFAEYVRPVFGSGQIGVFARWNMLHGNGERIGITDVLGGFPLTGRYQFAFDRQSWTLGGNIRLNFNLPF